MKLKLIIIAGIFSLSYIFQSCCRDIQDFFNITDFDLVLMDSKKYTDRVVTLNENDSMNFNNGTLQIQLDYTIDFVSDAGMLDYLSIDNFMTPVYGLTCPEAGESGSKEESLRDLIIITKNDFNQEYKAGDTITNLFAVVERFIGLTPIDEYISNNANQNIMVPTLLLQLTDPPTEDHDLIFDISVELSTGERYEQETLPIRVN